MAGIRVIAGSAKGRRLQMVPGVGARPITDRAKESLFNILGSSIRDASVLDMFAGTGSVGIEALSRGARHVDFIDLDRMAVKTVEANLTVTGFTGQARVLRKDAFNWLEQAAERAVYDLVYVAPPQYQGLWKQALLRLDANPGCLQPDAWIIAQIHPREYEQLHLAKLVEFDQRKYGSTLLVFYEWPSE
jgi:16S rRNA (guanine966-N2)-methyltransferase